jgi:hypothetical protein
MEAMSLGFRRSVEREMLRWRLDVATRAADILSPILRDVHRENCPHERYVEDRTQNAINNAS